MPTPRRNPTIAPRPETVSEEYSKGINPVIPGSKPDLPDLQKRVDQISQKDSDLKDFSIGLEDIDSAVFYYFKEVIKPYVVEDGNRVPVPVIYANPERFKSAQYDGNIRDKDGKILFPVITIRKVDIEKVRTLGNKLDGNITHNQYVFQQTYTKDNQYDNFAVLLNRKPVKRFQVVTIPDYHKITYSCEVHVNNERDLNKILEAITYASYSYWGDPKKFTFMSMIDSVPLTREVNTGENKRISATFNIILNGYIIPDTVNHYMSYNPTFYSKAQVVYNGETVTPIYSKGQVVASYVAPQTPVIINNTVTNTYVPPNITKQALPADIFTNSFYLRNAVIATAPEGAPPTSIDNFLVTINGQIISTPDISTITQSGPDVQVILNTLALGYPLQSAFEVIVKGAFSS
jgi:hypothetical protein